MRERLVQLLSLFLVLLLSLAACGGEPSYETAEPPAMPEEEETLPEIAADFVFLPETIHFEQDMWTAKIISAQGDTLFLLYRPKDEEIAVGVARVQRDGSGFETLWYGTEYREEESGRLLQLEVTDISATAARPAGGVFVVRHHYGGQISGDDFDIFETYTLMAIAPQGEVVQEMDLSQLLNIPAGTMFEIIRLQGLSDGRVLLGTLDSLYVLSADFQLERELPFPALDFIATRDDQVFVSLWDEEKERHLVLPFDLELGRINEGADSLFYAHLHNTVAGVDHDLYISTGQAVFGFDIQTRQFTTLFDWADLDIFTSFPAVPSDTGELFFIEQYWGLGDVAHSVTLVRMEKHEPPDVPEQVELLYGALLVDPVLRRELVAFNRANDHYRIRVREYYNRLSGDMDQARADFHADLLAGDVLDIVDFNLSSHWPHAHAGLLTDLGPLLDRDDTLARGQLVENLRQLLEIDGALYVIAGEFSIRSLVAPAYLDDVPPREYTLRSFSDLLRMEESFGGDVSFLGYPGIESTGAMLIPHTMLGISANSAHIESAWLFVRTILTEAFQEERIRSFSVIESQLEEQAARARRGRSLHEFPPEHTPLTQAQIRQILALIEEADLLYMMGM